MRAILVPCVVFIACCLDRGYQTDFWYHLARGRAIVSQARIVDVDAFTCTVAGTETRDANWIAQVLFYRLYQWGGLSLVQSINALVIATALATVFRLCRRAGAGGALSTAITSFTFLGLWQTFLIRPQSFSLLLFVLLYHILKYGSAQRRLICCPLIMAAWCNLHGGFPIGLVLIFSFVCSAFLSGTGFQLVSGRQDTGWKPVPLLLLLVSLLATLINPYGWHIYQYAGAITARALSRGIEEWLPPNLHQWVGLIFFASPILLGICFAIARRRPRPIEIFLMLLFFPLACHSVRMTAWWFLAIAPIFAGLLAERSCAARRMPNRDRGSRLPRLVCSLPSCASSACRRWSGLIPYLPRYEIRIESSRICTRSRLIICSIPVIAPASFRAWNGAFISTGRLGRHSGSSWMTGSRSIPIRSGEIMKTSLREQCDGRKFLAGSALTIYCWMVLIMHR